MTFRRSAVWRASVLACLMAAAGAARPQAVDGTFHWVGGTSVDWFDPANWDLAGPPNSAQAFVTIHPASFAAGIADLTVDLGSLNIATGAALALNGATLQFQPVDNPGGLPTFINQGTFTNNGSALLLQAGHVLQNGGALLNVGVGSYVYVDVAYQGTAGTIVNEGTWSHNQLFASGGTVQNSGFMVGRTSLSQDARLDNHASFEASDITLLDGATFHNHTGAHAYGESVSLQGPNASFINQGALEVDNLQVASGLFDNQAGGTVTVTSTVAAGTLHNRGTVNLEGFEASFAQLHGYSGSMLRNEGTSTLHALNGHVLQFDAGAEFVNDGTLQLSPGATLANNGLITNSGSVTIHGGAVLTGTGTYVQTGGATVIDGTFSQARTDIQGGTVRGDGSFNGYVTLGAGAQYLWRSATPQLHILPGATLEVAGSLAVPANGTPAVLNEGTFISQASSQVLFGASAVGGTPVLNEGTWINHSAYDEASDAGGLTFTGTFNNGVTGVVENHGDWDHAAMVSLGGVVTNTGQMRGATSLYNSAQLVNRGSLYGDLVARDAALIDNWGTMVRNKSSIALYDNSVFHNRSTGVIQGALALTGTGGTFINEGLVAGNNNVSPSGVARFENRAGGTINADGIFWARDMHSWGAITVNPGGELAVANLHLYGGSVTSINGVMTVNGNAVVLDAGATLSNAGMVLNRETFDNSGTITSAGTFYTNTLYNRASGTIESTGSFLVVPSHSASPVLLANEGVITNHGTFQVERLATLTNDGVFNHAAGTLTNNGVIVNAGAFTVGAGATVGYQTLDPDLPAVASFTQTGGVLTNDGVMSQALFDIQAGVVNGNGTFNGDFILGATAELRPGHSPGAITINGNFTQLGKIVLEVAGSGNGQFDVLHITGNAAFTGGVIELSFVDGYRPTAGEVFSFFDVDDGIQVGSGVIIEVAGLGEGYNVTVDTGNLGHGLGQLTIHSVTPVPEPQTYAMLLVGLTMLAAVRRRAGKAW